MLHQAGVFFPHCHPQPPRRFSITGFHLSYPSSSQEIIGTHFWFQARDGGGDCSHSVTRFYAASLRENGISRLLVPQTHTCTHGLTHHANQMDLEHAVTCWEDQHNVVFSSVVLCNATLKLLTSNQWNTNMRTHMGEKHQLYFICSVLNILVLGEVGSELYALSYVNISALMKNWRLSRLHRSHPDSPTPISCSVEASGASQRLPSSSSLPFLRVWVQAIWVRVLDDKYMY